MPENNAALFSRISALEKDFAVQAEKVKGLEKQEMRQWESLESITKSISEIQKMLNRVLWTGIGIAFMIAVQSIGWEKALKLFT